MRKLIIFLLLVAAGVWLYYWYARGEILLFEKDRNAGVPPFSISERIPEKDDLTVGQDRWRTAAPMPTPRIWLAAATLNSRIYTVGGMDAFGRTLDTVEVYDPFKDSWRPAAPLPKPLHHVGTAVIDDKLYVVGGLTGLSGRPVDTLYRFDPETSTWTSLQAMPKSLGAAGVIAYEGKLHLFGGRSSFGPLSIHLIYDPETDRWDSAEEMNTVRDSVVVAALDDELLVIGGRSGSAAAALGLVERWHVGNALWGDQTNISTRRSDFAAETVDGRIYLFGGEAATVVFSEIVVYDPATGKWLTLGNMPTPRHGFGSAVFNDMVFLIGGGHRPGWSVSDLNQVYIP